MRASNTHPTQIVSNVYNFVTPFIILILFINTTWTTVGYEHTGWRHVTMTYFDWRVVHRNNPLDPQCIVYDL